MLSAIGCQLSASLVLIYLIPSGRKPRAEG
jgi:hypothetical protein